MKLSWRNARLFSVGVSACIGTALIALYVRDLYQLYVKWQLSQEVQVVDLDPTPETWLYEGPLVCPKAIEHALNEARTELDREARMSFGQRSHTILLQERSLPTQLVENAAKQHCQGDTWVVQAFGFAPPTWSLSSRIGNEKQPVLVFSQDGQLCSPPSH